VLIHDADMVDALIDQKQVREESCKISSFGLCDSLFSLAHLLHTHTHTHVAHIHPQRERMKRGMPDGVTYWWSSWVRPGESSLALQAIMSILFVRLGGNHATIGGESNVSGDAAVPPFRI
jgi:hypothetical protein